jgi:hypothetical protein
MNSIPIPIRIQTGLGATLNIIVNFLVGGVFMLVLTGTPGNPTRPLLQTNFLGYRTKILILIALALVIGFSFTLLGDIVTRYLVRSLFIPKRTREKMTRIHAPYQANIQIITKAFDWHTARAEVTLAVPGETKFETQIERNYAMAGTMLKHYTSLYKDIANDFWYLRAQRDFATGTFVALICAAVWVQQWRGILLCCGGIFAIFAWYLSFLSTRSYGYLISVGYFRERGSSESSGLEK